MKRHLLMTFLAVLTLTEGAPAQGLSIKSAELSLSIGETSSAKKTFTIGPPQSSIPINGEMQLNSGTMYEARINFFTSNRIGSEILYGYQYSGVTFNRNTAPASSFSVPLVVHNFALNLLYYPLGKTDSQWRPFVNVGGGAVIYRPSTGGQASAKDPLQGNFDTFFESSRGAAMGGGGVKRTLTRKLGFRADADAVFTKVPTFGLPESSAQANATVLPVGGLVHSFRVSAGLIIYLGK